MSNRYAAVAAQGADINMDLMRMIRNILEGSVLEGNEDSMV